MHRLYIMALAAVGMMCLLAVFVAPHPSAAPVTLASASAKPQRPSATEALLLQRDSSGQFHLEASVNGAPVEFLVDTGADVVALTEQEALNLGLNVSEGDFQPVMKTASGVGYGAQIKLDELEVAGDVARGRCGGGQRAGGQPARPIGAAQTRVGPAQRRQHDNSRALSELFLLTGPA